MATKNRRTKNRGPGPEDWQAKVDKMSQHAVESPTEAIERFRSLYSDLGSGTVEDHFDPIITLGAALSQRMIEADATNGDYWKACVATEFAPLPILYVAIAASDSET